MRVHIAVRVARPGTTARRLRAVVAHALRRERCPPSAEVSLALVTDGTIRRLNRRYRGMDRVTDVLAFPLDTRLLDRHILGEVVISVDRARVQARAIGHPVHTEIALLAVHGLLHLLGYDDRTTAGADQMIRRQRMLVSEAGEEVRG